MEEQKAIVKIKGKEYPMKFTIGFWKSIKEQCGVVKSNMEMKLQNDFGTIAPVVILQGIYYGMNPIPDKIEDIGITIAEIETELDYSVMDAIEQAVINGMTKAEKELVEVVKKDQQDRLKSIQRDLDDPAKKK